MDRHRSGGPALPGVPGRPPSALALLGRAEGSPLVVARYGTRLHAWDGAGDGTEPVSPAVSAFIPDPDNLGLIAATVPDAEILHFGSLPSAPPQPGERAARAAARRTGWHDDTVLSLASARTPGGGIVLSGSADHSARLWNLRDGSLRGVLDHTAPVRAVALGGPWRRLLAVTATVDRALALWDANTGECLRHEPSLPAAARGVAFGWLSRRLVLLAACEDGRLRMWDARTGAPRGTIDSHDGPVTALAVHRAAGREQYVTGGEDGRVRVWDLRPVRAAQASGHSGAVRAMCWTTGPGGRPELITAAEGDEGACLVARRAPDGALLGAPWRATPGVRSLLACGGGATGRVALLDDGGTLRLWNPAEDIVVPLNDVAGEAPAPMTAVAVDGRDDSRLVYADAEGTVRLRDLTAVETDRKATARAAASASTEAAAPDRRIDPDTFGPVPDPDPARDDGAPAAPPTVVIRLGRPCSLIGYHAGRIVTCQDDGLLQAWGGAGRQATWSARPSEVPIGVLATGRWGGHDVVALGTADGVLHVYDIPSGAHLAHTRTHDGPVTALAFFRQGDLTALVSAGEDGRTVVWDGNARTETLTGHAEAAWCVAAAAHAPLLATGGAQGTLSLWRREP
ncbi:hypothetical protein [Streptomyces sp. NPDC021020]|uniref:hypothetical protein n=1 Tax=Streptomyces sp. NPDC021020 TaxID=3365109 RepID=UPI00378A6EFB